MPKPARHAPIHLSTHPHGNLLLTGVTVAGYSLKLRNKHGFLGDTVSRTGFAKMLDAWRRVFKDMHGDDPLGDKPTGELGKKRIDALLAKGGKAAAVIEAAIEDYAHQFADVIPAFLADPSWRDVERIVIGGGFPQCEVGQRAVRRTSELLKVQRLKVQLVTLRHHADEGGLIGWAHLAPERLTASYKALLAVDIGGTNVRCGIVQMHARREPDLSKIKVIGREKWTHAEDDEVKRRGDLIDGIAEMLEDLIAQAKRADIHLAPFVGVACPGVVCPDGSIAEGTQNLPGNWESAGFNLPEALRERLPRIQGNDTEVMLHNDAVVQGLSEVPFMTDVTRWAVLTVGTGLGNASYTNLEK